MSATLARPAVTGIDSVLFFVADIDVAAAWYADLFGVAVQHENPQYAFLSLPWMKLGFHPADAKNPVGGRSQAIYLSVPAVAPALAALQARGATLKRGPARTDLGEWACLLDDPFGGQLGLLGAAA